MSCIEFNGKKIHFFRINGENWIIVKSVCEDLNVDFEHQRRLINDDPILGSASHIWMHKIDGDDQKRLYFCLREDYVYGWIFSIHSKSENLLTYKRERYNILFKALP